MRRAARTDGNHAAILRALRRIPGLVVVDTHALGDGFPDAMIGWQKKWHPIEIKRPDKPPSAKRLTPAEQRFADTARAAELPYHVVETVEDVLAAVGIGEVTISRGAKRAGQVARATTSARFQDR